MRKSEKDDSPRDTVAQCTLPVQANYQLCTVPKKKSESPHKNRAFTVGTDSTVNSMSDKYIKAGHIPLHPFLS